MANDKQNHTSTETTTIDTSLKDGLSAAQLFSNHDGLTYK